MHTLKYIILYVILTLVFLSCGGEESTEPVQTGSIIGRIYDSETALPISAANVSSEPPTSAVTTDTTGTYTIQNVDPETYTMTAYKLGYAAGTAKISVTAGNSTIADIFLNKDSTLAGFK